MSSKTMPAQSGDPISSVLHHSLSTSFKKYKSGEDIDSRICDKQQILSSEIKYEKTKSYNTTILNNLKTKYIVLYTVGSSSNSEEVTSTRESVVSEVSSTRKLFPSSKEPISLPTPKRVLYSPDSVRLGWSGSAAVGSGFVNLGNTCYLNSSLQALFHVPAFVNWLLTDTNHSSKCESLNGVTHSECLICAMCKTLQSSQKNTGSVIKPNLIYSKLKLICKHLTHGHQEDAHEFLRYLIEGMERSYLTIFNGIKLDNYSKETTPLSQIFGGYLRSEVTCLECQHVSTTFQHFQDLLLDIRTATSVDDALESFFSRERLGDGDQAYRCEQCKRRVAATKKFTIERPPKALCIALKRFGAMGGKNSKTISLKQFLDIDKFRHQRSISEPCLYKLVSMVTHLGPSSSCGHYTAVGQTPSGTYYLFDDTLVRSLPIQNVLNSNPYILMYELDTESKKQPITPKKEIATNGFSNSNGLSTSSIESKQSTSSSINNNLSGSNACVSTSPQMEVKSGQNGLSFYQIKNKPFKLHYLGRIDNHQAGSSFTGPRFTNGDQTSFPQQKNETLKNQLPQNLQQNNISKQTPLKESTSCSVEKPVIKPIVSPYKAPPSKLDLPQSSSPSKPQIPSSLSKPSSSQSSSPEKTSLSRENSVSKIPLPICTPEKKIEEKVHNNPDDHKSSPSLSLVPYEFDGESDSEFVPPKSNLTKDNNKLGNKTCERLNPPTVQNIKGVRVEIEGSNHIQGHNRPDLHSIAGSSSSGKWSVTSLEKDKSLEQSEKVSTSKTIIEQNDRISNGTSSSNGAKNYRWEEPKNNNSTLRNLMRKSHNGYGSQVNSWNGGRSEMDIQIADERERQKRNHDSYDEDFDRGKVKKVKTNHMNDNYRNIHNRFQTIQNQKNMHYFDGNRRRYYKDYTQTGNRSKHRFHTPSRNHY